MSVTIRPVRPADVPAVVAMVHELAAYERAPHLCQLRDAQLHAALFCAAPALFGHVAEDPSGELVAMMLWFRNFSTWNGRHGIYLEDLYVHPQARGSGVGRSMLAHLAGICLREGYPRLEWWVLHWNPARDFYAAIGAEPMDQWVPYRLTGAALARLASPAGPGAPDNTVANPAQRTPHDEAATA